MNHELYATAGFLDDAKKKVWDPDAGVFQNALNVAGIGALLGLGGNIGILVGVANFLGLGLPAIGKYLDDALGNKDLADVNFDELGSDAASKIWETVSVPNATAQAKNQLYKSASDIDPELAARLDKEIADVKSERVPEPKKVVRIMDAGKAERAARVERERLREENRAKARQEQWDREDAVAAAKEKRDIAREERMAERENEKHLLKGIQERAKITQKQVADTAKADAAAAERARRDSAVSTQDKADNASKLSELEAKREHDFILAERARKLQLEDEERKSARRAKEEAEHAKLTKAEQAEKRKYEAKRDAQRHKAALQLLNKRNPGTLGGLKSMGGKAGLAVALAGLAAFLFSHFSPSAEKAKTPTEESRSKEDSASKSSENSHITDFQHANKNRKAVMNNVINEILNQ